MKEVPDVIERHDDHHQSSQNVDRLNPHARERHV
jgi:hypothetical protein